MDMTISPSLIVLIIVILLIAYSIWIKVVDRALRDPMYLLVLAAVILFIFGRF